MEETPKYGSDPLEPLLSLIEAEVRAGIRHGHFDYQVTGEILNGKKCQVTVKAGKSHRFVIGPWS